jgi:hypothetical protein
LFTNHNSKESLALGSGSSQLSLNSMIGENNIYIKHDGANDAESKYSSNTSSIDTIFKQIKLPNEVS